MYLLHTELNIIGFWVHGSGRRSASNNRPELKSLFFFIISKTVWVSCNLNLQITHDDTRVRIIDTVTALEREEKNGSWWWLRLRLMLVWSYSSLSRTFFVFDFFWLFHCVQLAVGRNDITTLYRPVAQPQAATVHVNALIWIPRNESFGSAVAFVGDTAQNTHGEPCDGISC